MCAPLDIEKPSVRKVPWKMSFHQLCYESATLLQSVTQGDGNVAMYFALHYKNFFSALGTI